MVLAILQEIHSQGAVAMLPRHAIRLAPHSPQEVVTGPLLIVTQLEVLFQGVDTRSLQGPRQVVHMKIYASPFSQNIRSGVHFSQVDMQLHPDTQRRHDSERLRLWNLATLLEAHFLLAGMQLRLGTLVGVRMKTSATQFSQNIRWAVHLPPIDTQHLQGTPWGVPLKTEGIRFKPNTLLEVHMKTGTGQPIPGTQHQIHSEVRSMPLVPDIPKDLHLIRKTM